MHSTNGHGPKSEAERVALLMRVSSEEQRERETIEIQDEFLNQYCGLYELEVAEIYKDDGISGTIPLHERPEGRRLLEDAKAGNFDAVLVYKLDRLGRSLLVIVDAHDRLQAASVSLRSATEPIDTSTPSGRLIFQMLASFAEYERETIGERTRAGLHRALRQGKHFGRIPYGYVLAPDGRSLAVVEEEAVHVREIISRVAAGATLYSEAKRLNELGVPSPGWRFRNGARKHGASWARATVGALIHQSAYSGIHRVSTGAGEVIERAVPVIVAPELQQQAEARLAENKRYPERRTSHKYLLSGLVKCEMCGLSCVGRTTTSRDKKYPYYACIPNRPESGETPTHRAPHVSAPWLEGVVWDDIRTFLQDPGKALTEARAKIEAVDASGELEARHEDLIRRRGAKLSEKDRYVKLYAQGHLDEYELETYLADLRVQTDNLALLIESVEADIAARREKTELAATAEAWLIRLKERITEVEGDAGYHERRQLVRLLVERITIGRKENGRPKVQITYRFGPPQDQEFAGSEQNSPQNKPAKHPEKTSTVR